MANRAYLFSGDRDDPDAWRHRGEIYYDSRWTIPLSWWFFFRAPDIRWVDVNYDGSSWQEVKFVADKDEAMAAFVERRELLLTVLSAPASDEVISHFFNTLLTWPGKYLLMDPEEVFGEGGEDEEVHYRRCLRILDTIDAKGSVAKDVAEAVSVYSSVEFESQDKFIRQVVGYTYR